MLEQKQIEEMSEDIARMLCEIYRPNCDEYEPHSCSYCYVNSTQIGCFVEMLYNAGYRKQIEAEWKEDIVAFCNVCSACKARVDRYAIKGNGGKLNFCPNCGARMKGGAE